MSSSNQIANMHKKNKSKSLPLTFYDTQKPRSYYNQKLETYNIFIRKFVTLLHAYVAHYKHFK